MVFQKPSLSDMSLINFELLEKLFFDLQCSLHFFQKASNRSLENEAGEITLSVMLIYYTIVVFYTTYYLGDYFI